MEDCLCRMGKDRVKGEDGNVFVCYSHALSGLQEMVEERMSPGSSQGEVPGCEGLLELSSWVILEAQNKAEALSDILLVLAYCQRCSESAQVCGYALQPTPS